MKAKIHLENSDNIYATIEFTMTIKQWKELRDQMSDEYPSWKMSSAINTLVYKAQQEYQGDSSLTA